MGYLILTAIVLLITIIGWFVGVGLKGTPEETWAKPLRYGSLVIGVLFIAVFTVVRSFHSVPAGTVGVVYQFGNIVGQTPAGLVTTKPWQSLREANVQVQKQEFPQLDSFSQETQDVFIKATLNYQVSPTDIQTLYRTVGPDYFDKLVPNRVNQFFKDETVKYAAVDVAPNRDQIRVNVLKKLKSELAPYSIQVDDLLIDNIGFSKEFTKAIEDKQIATQEAQAAKNRVAQAEFQADQIIKKAEGEAQANRLKRQTLTPLLVQQNAIDKLNPNVQVIVVDSKSIVSLGDILNQTKTGK